MAFCGFPKFDYICSKTNYTTMPTLRNICSDIQTELKANNIDDRYSYRFLSSRIKDKVRNFLKQDADSRRILKLPELWNTFPIIEMEEIPYVNYNVDVPDIRTVRRSKNKITKTFSTNYGNLLAVFTISGDSEYKLIRKIQYKDILNIEYRDKRIKYAWIENDYLEIPDSNVELVKLAGLPENPEEIDCDKCAAPLDVNFPLPGYILDVVKKDILNELLQAKRINPDENPNLNSNQK